MVVYDTGFKTTYPPHRCGRVLDYCIYDDTKIFFCIYCKKVITAKKEAEIRVTIKINTDAKINDIDESLLEDLK